MRTRGAARCLALAAIACVVSAAPAAAAPASAPLERDVLRLVNETRASRGLAPLELRAALVRAARAHSRDMVVRGYYAHDTLGGPTFARRILGYYRARRVVGETLGWGTGAAATPEAIVAGWLRSPPHRATLLDARYSQVGIGVAAGTLSGTAGARVYTADFGG